MSGATSSAVTSAVWPLNTCTGCSDENDCDADRSKMDTTSCGGPPDGRCLSPKAKL